VERLTLTVTGDAPFPIIGVPVHPVPQPTIFTWRCGEEERPPSDGEETDGAFVLDDAQALAEIPRLFVLGLSTLLDGIRRSLTHDD
jgi:hypothetical protein